MLNLDKLSKIESNKPLNSIFKIQCVNINVQITSSEVIVTWNLNISQLHAFLLEKRSKNNNLNVRQ